LPGADSLVLAAGKARDGSGFKILLVGESGQGITSSKGLKVLSGSGVGLDILKWNSQKILERERK
jgi:hypothetical protein